MQGIQNLGSTCAINSLLQIMSRNDNIASLILRDDRNGDKGGETLTSNLREILILLKSENETLIKPYKFINYLYNTFSYIFRKGEQIDIYELWLFIYNKLIEENSNIDIYEKKNKNLDLNDKHHNIIGKYNNFKTCDYIEYNQGSFIQIVECNKCNNKIINFEPFISITLDLNEDNKPSVADLLIKYLKVDKRKADEWKCEICNDNTDYIKMNKIWKIPKTLILIINRFKDFNFKNLNEVNINREIVFKKNSLLNYKDDIKYTLQSIGLHHGLLSGGHYTSICKNKKDDNFYFYNDECVSLINNENLNNILNDNKDCYMLFYNLE